MDGNGADLPARGREQVLSDLREKRGAAIWLTDPLLAPPGIMHYEPGPITVRHYDRHGEPWLVLYEAEHDGAGWLVVRAFCRPLFILPGDSVHLRAMVLEHHGDLVRVAIEGLRGAPVRFWVSPKAVVYLEEHPRADPAG